MVRPAQFRSDAEVRKVLQEIVDGRLRLLPVSEHTGHLYVHFKAGRVRTVEWRTLDNPDEWSNEGELTKKREPKPDTKPGKETRGPTRSS